ncbi:MAG: hypothetical protein RLZZ210_1353, partial [Pseudomonadota bacterium]
RDKDINKYKNKNANNTKILQQFI